MRRLMAVYIFLVFTMVTAVLGFPQIPGPKSFQDRIAIIGAGPAGVHMAYKLKTMGFNNVVILERSNRIGGKCFDYKYRGAPQMMGAKIVTPDYEEVKNLSKMFNGGNLIPADYNNWPSEKAEEPVSLLEYFLKSSGIKNPMELMFILQRYIALHRRLFGDYDGEIMPQPSKKVLDEIQGSLKSFLQRNKLEKLEPFFNLSLTLNGYSDIENLPALYALMFITPTLMESYFRDPSRTRFYLENGYQALWENIVRATNISVRFNVDITRIIRRNGPLGILILYRDRRTGLSRYSYFDFLITTPTVTSLFNVMDFTRTERNLFRKLTEQTYFVTWLVDSNYGKRGPAANNIYIDTVLSPKVFKVSQSVDAYSTINNITQEEYKSGRRPGGPDGRLVQSSIYSQQGNQNPLNYFVSQDVTRKLRAHLNAVQRNNHRIIARANWNYFVHFPIKDIDEGILWDIFNVQGNRNTWFAGSSVCFESVKSVVEYNKLLLRQATLPKV